MEFLIGLSMALYFVFGFGFGKLAAKLENRTPNYFDLLLWPIGLVILGIQL